MTMNFDSLLALQEPLQHDVLVCSTGAVLHHVEIPPTEEAAVEVSDLMMPIEAAFSSPSTLFYDEV